MPSLQLPLLDRIRIASPCAMKWDHMTPVGDGERVRRCDQCRLSVHNISDMTRDESEAFLRSIVPGGRVCGALWRRADGAILTRDCPVGLRAVRRRLVRLISRAAAAIAVVLTGAAYARSRGLEGRWGGSLASLEPFSSLTHWVRGRSAPARPQQIEMGLIDLQSLLSKPVKADGSGGS